MFFRRKRKMFIYVMDEKARDKLIELGYKLLKFNGESVWVFVNKKDLQFSEQFKYPHVVSDKLVF